MFLLRPAPTPSPIKVEQSIPMPKFKTFSTKGLKAIKEARNAANAVKSEGNISQPARSIPVKRESPANIKFKPYKLKQKVKGARDRVSDSKTNKDLAKENKRLIKELNRLNKMIKRAKNKNVKQELIHKRDKIRGWEYKIHKISENFNQKFQTWFDEYQIEVGKKTSYLDVSKIFMEILLKVKKERELVNGDKIRLIVSHDIWAKPYSSQLANVNEGFEKMMASKCGNFVEYKSVPLNEVKIEVQSFKVPRGKGRITTVKTNLPSKRCVISIKNDDTTCLARAIVTAMANVNKDKWTKTQLQDGFNKSRKLQKEEALKLHEEAGLM
jgi:hypothetical protein